MKKKIGGIIGRARTNHHLWEVIKGSSSALMIRTLGTLIGFAVSVMIARLLGPEGSGIYYLAIAVATIAATVSCFGFDNTVVRFIAAHASVQEWGAVNFVYRTAMKVVVVVSLVISAVLFFGADWLANSLFDKPYMELPLKLVSLSVLPLSITMIQADSLRGLKNIRSSQWIKTVFTSLGTILLLYPLVGLMGANGSVAAFVIATLLTAFIAWLIWKRAWQSRNEAIVNSRVLLTMNSLFRSSWPLFGVALTGLVMQQAATIFIGVWGSAEDVGVFNVASRVANLLLFPLMAMISILTPKFAAMYKQGQLKELARLARNSSKILTVFALLAVILVAVETEWILSVFGAKFKEGSTILRILLIGVVVNVATGAVAELLMMCGRERLVSLGVFSSAALTLLLCLILIPNYGMVGAAIAATSGMAVQNALMVLAVKSKLGFWPVAYLPK